MEPIVFGELRCSEGWKALLMSSLCEYTSVGGQFEILNGTKNKKSDTSNWLYRYIIKIHV